MPDLPAPVASRLPRARWLDARLLLGVLLVLVSVVVGSRVVAAADDTSAVWSLRHDVGADSVLSARDVEQRQVQLGADQKAYFTATDGNPVGRVVRHSLARGELVPWSALAKPGDAVVRRVSLNVDAFVAASLERGSVVDVYRVGAGPSGGSGAAPSPAASGTRRLLASVSVDTVDKGGKGLGAAAGRATVVLLLNEAEVPVLLDAQAAGSVELVQVPAAKADVE